MNNRTEEDKRADCAAKFPEKLPEGWTEARKEKSLEEECRNLWHTVFYQLLGSGKYKPFEAALDASSVVEEYRKQFSND